MKDFMKDDHGFSLAEILVAAGLLGALSVGVMHIMKQQTTIQKTAETGLEVTSIHASMIQNLLNQEACHTTLSPLGNIKHNTGINEIKNRHGKPIFNKTDLYGNRALKIKQMELRNVTITPNPVPSGQTGYGEATVAVTFEKQSKIIKGAKIVTKEIPIKVEVNDNYTVTNCYNPAENAIVTAKKEACEGIGGTFNSTTSMCSLSDYPGTIAADKAVSTKYLEDKKLQDFDPRYVNVTGDTMTGKLTVENEINAQKLCIRGHCRETFSEQTRIVHASVTAVRRPNATAKCASNEVVVGGGGSCHVSDAYMVWIVANRPDGNGWYISCFGMNGYATVTAHVWAICMKK